MKPVKLTKKMLKMHPVDLLVKLGAVDEVKKQTYPQHVYVSKEDYRELRKNLLALAKKGCPGTSSRLINLSVGMDLLNYGPNETFGNVIRPGYALIDVHSIEKGLS